MQLIKQGVGALSDSDSKDARIWQAVVLQALLDAANLSRNINPSWSVPNREFMHKRVADEAKLWFTENSRDFQDVCLLANLDSELIRKFALRVTKGDLNAKKSLIEWRDWFKRPRNKAGGTKNESKDKHSN